MSTKQLATLSFVNVLNPFNVGNQKENIFPQRKLGLSKTSAPECHNWVNLEPQLAQNEDMQGMA